MAESEAVVRIQPAVFPAPAGTTPQGGDPLVKSASRQVV